MFATLAGVRARSVLSFVESEAFVFPRPVTKKTEEPEAFLSSVCSLQSSLFVVGLSRFSARLGPHLAGAHAPRTRGNPLTPSRGFLFVYRFVSVCLGPLFGFGFLFPCSGRFRLAIPRVERERRRLLHLGSPGIRSRGDPECFQALFCFHSEG